MSGKTYYIDKRVLRTIADAGNGDLINSLNLTDLIRQCIIANGGVGTTNTNSPLQGDGSVGSPITFADGTANDQVLQWNGSAWVATILSVGNNVYNSDDTLTADRTVSQAAFSLDLSASSGGNTSVLSNDSSALVITTASGSNSSVINNSANSYTNTINDGVNSSVTTNTTIGFGFNNLFTALGVGTSRIANSSTGVSLNTTHTSSGRVNSLGFNAASAAIVAQTSGGLDVLSTSGLTLVPHTLTTAGAGTAIRFVESNTSNGSNYIAFKAPDAITTDFTLVLPDSDGDNGDVIATDGSGNLTFMPRSNVLITNSAAGNYIVANGDDLILKTGITGGGDTVTLPETPETGKTYHIKDAAGTAGTDNITIDTTGAPTIDGAASVVINTNFQSYKFVFDGTNYHII